MVNSTRKTEFMALAIQLAKKPEFSPHPNPRVGCVIVKNLQIVGLGFHQYAGAPHAEINALREAGDLAEDATAYVSLEPCCHQGRTPPCVNALIKAKVKKVVIAMLDPNPKVAGRGVKLLEQAGIDVEFGLLQEQSESLNKGFISRMTRGRPWVRCKIAMSLDGRTAMASGESQWITGSAARKDVQRYRAKSDAILTGVGTVALDNPRMTTRGIEAKNSLERQPLRIVVDSQLRSSPAGKIYQGTGKVLIANVAGDKAKYPENVTVKSFATDNQRVNLPLLISHLATLEINEVQVEAGATLNGALLIAGLIDELVLYMAPVVMGDSARGLFSLPELQQMKNKITFRNIDIRQIGENFRLTLQPEY